MTTNLFQIWITDNNQPTNEYITNQCLKLKNMYSDCNYKLYTDREIKSFLFEFFDTDVVLAYEKCKPYAFKSDLARYCLLYTYSGYYYDISICPEFRLAHNENSIMLLGEPVEIDGITYNLQDNGMMYFKNAKDDFLKIAIENCVSNILSHNYGLHPLDITGPMMLYKINHNHITLYPYSIKDNKKVVDINGQIWLNYPNGFSSENSVRYKNNNIFSYGKAGTNNYAEMWFNKTVFKGKARA
jgi:mannosyltransferase OCH1-like enzyme